MLKWIALEICVFHFEIYFIENISFIYYVLLPDCNPKRIVISSIYTLLPETCALGQTLNFNIQKVSCKSHGESLFAHQVLLSVGFYLSSCDTKRSCSFLKKARMHYLYIFSRNKMLYRFIFQYVKNAVSFHFSSS